MAVVHLSWLVVCSEIGRASTAGGYHIFLSFSSPFLTSQY